MADSKAVYSIVGGLLFLANEAQRAGLADVTRVIANAVDDIANHVDRELVTMAKEPADIVIPAVRRQ